MAEDTAGRDTPPQKFRRSGEASEREDKPGVLGINVDRLPDEVMVNIFSYLSFNDLVDSVQNVCTRWKRLAHDPVLWLDKEYIIRGRVSIEKGRRCCGVVWSKCIHCRYEGKDKQILRTASVTPQLRKLTLMRSVRASVLQKICANWPNLTVLQIDGNRKMEESLIKNIFEKCPKIQKLKLKESLLVGQQSGEFLSSLEHLRSLEVFKDRYSVTGVSMRVVADACPRLQEISFQCDGHNKNEVDYFFRAKRHSITSVKLSWMFGTVDSMYVLPMLKQCHALRKLEVQFYELPNWLEPETFEAFGELHSLEELSIKSDTAHRPKVMCLAFRPGCLTQLRRLRLDTLTLHSEIVVAISRGCPNLCELRLLSAGLITDTALSEMHCLKHLKILELSRCRLLGGAALTHIAELPALQTLILNSFEDMTVLQPGLLDILKMKELRSLKILKCRNIQSVPFYQFPGRLVKLRELCVTANDEEEPFCKQVLAELQSKMPHLRVFNTVWLEEEESPSYDERYNSCDSCDSGDTDHYGGYSYDW